MSIYKSDLNLAVELGKVVNSISILENGNVGIGTNNPQSKLHIANLILINSQQDLLIIESHTNIGEGGNSILFRNRWNNGSYWNMARITAVEQTGYGGQLSD